MRHLVIGGAGFIGINTADYFLKKGEHVTIFDNLSRTGTIDNLTWIKQQHPAVKIIIGDIRIDQEKLKRAVEQTDVIYHLAGQVAVTTSVTQPRQDFEINVLGTINLLEAIRQSNHKPILLFSSTNKVYGGMEDLTIVEKDRAYTYRDFPLGIPEERCLDFHSPYGCSKGAADQYIRDYARIYGLKTVVFRQSCIYGPRQFGIEDQGWVAWFTIATLRKHPLTIYGDGKQARDVLYIDDLIAAYEKATQHIKHCSGKIYNIGGGSHNTLSLLKLIAILEKLHGTTITYKKAPWRPGDQKVYISNITKAQTELGWQPHIGVEEGVTKLFHWVNKNQTLFS